MDTRFLESLMAVIDLGSIVAAARAQGLTAAAVSQRIQVLEQEIGAPLLTRRANAAEATPLCLDLLPAMRQIAGLCQRLRQQADPGQAEGVLRIGAISTQLTGRVPGLLTRLRALAPGIELQVEPGSSAGLYESLRARRIDAALIVAPPFDPAPGLALREMGAEPLCLLAPADLPDLPVAEVFRRLPLIAYDPNSWGGRIAGSYLHDHAIATRRFCALDGLEAIADLVASGIGASLVPLWPGLVGARALPDGARYARRIVLATVDPPPRPACVAALHASLDP